MSPFRTPGIVAIMREVRDTIHDMRTAATETLSDVLRRAGALTIGRQDRQ